MKDHCSSIPFWLAAAAAAVTVLCGSVAAGRLIGEHVLATRRAPAAAPLRLDGLTPPEVIGGRPLAAAIPGDPVSRWNAEASAPSSP
jgi:hypothetical protein